MRVWMHRLDDVSEPTLAEQRQNRLLQIAVSSVVLCIWTPMVVNGSLPDGVGYYVALPVGPAAFVELCYAGWRYRQLRRTTAKV
jgi:hypothetical protein